MWFQQYCQEAEPRDARSEVISWSAAQAEELVRREKEEMVVLVHHIKRSQGSRLGGRQLDSIGPCPWMEAAQFLLLPQPLVNTGIYVYD